MEYNFEDQKFSIVRNKLKFHNSILKLYKETSSYNKTIDFVHNKYNTAIYGKSEIGFLAFDGANIAAYYGAFPMRLSWKNIDFVAAQSGDTLTHPNYQKKGLFTHLAKETYKLAKEENIQLIFGFPNKNSLPGFQKKLNWVFDDKIKEIVFAVNTIPLGELSSKFSLLNKWYINYSKIILKRFKVNASEISLEGFNTQVDCLRVVKDIDFFKYKSYSDAVLIRRNDFLIYLKVDTHLIIGDVAFFEKHRLPQFIATIKRLAQILLVFKIKFYMSQNHWLYSYLHEEYTSKDNNYIGFCFLNNEHIIDIKKALFTAADFDTF